MRSYSAASQSSLSSLASSCPSVGSVSSLSSLLPSCGEGRGAFESNGREDFGSMSNPPSALGKRKRRRRNPKKEGERQAKRQKVNPRKRGGSKRERIDRGKRREAEGHAVEWEKDSTVLRRSKKVEPKQVILDLEGIKGEGIRIVSWDGM